MTNASNRRQFLLRSGFSLAATQWLMGLPSLARAQSQAPRKRLVILFSPNGVIPDHFWPDQEGRDFELKRILQPLADFKSRLLTLNGVCNRIQGDGDGHMRGIGCLLTGIELFPGDVQGGSDTPAGWSQGISIDQFVKNQLQSQADTQTRFGSLEFGVMVPKRADTWTRMSYAGPNQPVAPIDNPYMMLDRLYGQTRNREMLSSVMNGLAAEFRKAETIISSEDRRLLDEHMTMVRSVETELQNEVKHREKTAGLNHAAPSLPANVEEVNDNIPQITKLQMDLMVSSFMADFARVATFQITNSVGQPKMRWLDIDEGHHELSHEPDSNEPAYEKLIKINSWYCEQVAYLAKRLAETPEPGGDGSMLDHTTILWTNELGKGNSHTRDNIPFVMVGEGLGWQMGRSLKFGGVPHNRLLMSIAEGMGFPVPSFGNADFCKDGPLTGLAG